MSIREAVHGGLHVGLQQGLVVGARVYDPDGRLVHEVVQPAHSYVVNWAHLLNYHLSEAAQSSTGITDVSGNSRTLATTSYFHRPAAAAATSVYGIVVGTGATAVAMTDTALVTQVAHGTSAGQLNHYAVATYPVDTTGANPRYTNISRAFQNNSGTAIAIAEVGMYSQHATTVGSPSTFLVARDLLSFTIGVGQLSIVQYALIFNLT